MTDRAVSVTVNYALNLAIATILIAVLLGVTGGMIDDRQRLATRGELAVSGERLAAHVERADQLAMAGADDLTVTTAIPDTVAGHGYAVELVAEPDGAHVELSTSDPDVTVSVPLANSTHVINSSSTGGDVEIVLDGGALEVRSA